MIFPQWLYVSIYSSHVRNMGLIHVSKVSQQNSRKVAKELPNQLLVRGCIKVRVSLFILVRYPVKLVMNERKKMGQ